MTVVTSSTHTFTGHTAITLTDWWARGFLSILRPASVVLTGVLEETAEVSRTHLSHHGGVSTTDLAVGQKPAGPPVTPVQCQHVFSSLNWI